MAGPELSNLAMEEMTKRGIEVKTNVKIQKVTEDGFVLGDGKLLEKEIRIWTAGVRAPRWLGKVGLQTNAASRVLANKFLKVRKCQHFLEPLCPFIKTQSMFKYFNFFPIVN